MRWDIEPKIACELWFFSSISFGGTKRVARVHAYGGLQGDTIDGSEVRSVGIIAEPGVRVIFKTAATEIDWEEVPWRAVTVTPGFTGSLNDGRTAVRIPDLDRYDPPTADRTDPELESDFQQVARLADGTAWTFGRSGRRTLKCNLRSIRIERVDR